MSAPHSSSRLAPALIAGYLVLLVATVAGYMAIRRHGERLTAPHLAANAWRAVAATSPLQALASVSSDSSARPMGTLELALHVVVALAAVIVVGRALGLALRRIEQPPVIGEVLAGILLGPSLLGWLWPEAQALLLPPQTAAPLGALAQVAVVAYMFLVGLEFDAALVAPFARQALLIAHAAIALPFVFGALLALGLYAELAPAGVDFTRFSLFLGVSLSVTAFPVLARILADRRMRQTPLGTLALACAAIDDATAWCLLALVVGVAQARLHEATTALALSLAYVVLLALVVRPLVTRPGRWLVAGPPGAARLALVVAAVAASAWATQWIGIHAIFGAFLLGVIVPRDSPLARGLIERYERPIATLLLPAFFAYTGMHTEIGLLSSASDWLVCAGIVAVATLGKVGGTLLSARVVGLAWSDALRLGVLMNTRGLVELLILGIGLELGVVSPRLYAMLVLMALATTLATSPLVGLLGPAAEEPAAPPPR